jgi:shikimate dehydrogenase
MNHGARRLAVVGHPISHSLSPKLHNAAYEFLGLPWTYSAIDVAPGEFDEFLRREGSSFHGLSVTMPHKVSALEACKEIDLIAERTHSVNTLLFSRDSSARFISGFNTDVAGIVHALSDAGFTQSRHAAIIGGGATASSAVVAAAEIGAEHISVFVRTPENAFYLEQVGQQCGVNVTVHHFNAMAQLSEVDLVISTLPGDVELSLADLPRSPRATLLDVVYNPWPSVRATEWSVAGGEVVSGLRMLAHQALIQVRIFVTGSPLQPIDNEQSIKNAMFSVVGLESH